MCFPNCEPRRSSTFNEAWTCDNQKRRTLAIDAFDLWVRAVQHDDPDEAFRLQKMLDGFDILISRIIRA